MRAIERRKYVNIFDSRQDVSDEEKSFELRGELDLKPI